MSKILINASNLHVGGGVQVAASFITELFYLERFDLSIVCSLQVFNSLDSSVEIGKFISFSVIDVFGFNQITNAEKQQYFDGFDICFTIFGPFYNKIEVKTHLCGFAQPWIIYADAKFYQRLPFLSAIKNKLFFAIKKWYFFKHDILIVEHDDAKRGLIEQGFLADKIHVVSNTISSIYDNPETWEPIYIEKKKEVDIYLGAIGRGYEHKNLSLLNNAVDILKSDFGLNVVLLVTLTDSEMKELNFLDNENIVSCGSIKVTQCPSFYNLIDFLVFPSLLESFSASPIEAFKMQTPVLASDKSFIKEICKDGALYFDPYDAKKLASLIFDSYQNKELINSLIDNALQVVTKLPTARDRAINYLSIIDSLD